MLNIYYIRYTLSKSFKGDMMLDDITISRNTVLKPITEIAKNLGVDENDLELYGKYKAKVNVKTNAKAKLILVTAINPTAAGEGKTTVSIGLADAMNKLGKKTCLALREPSLGPVFGIKGGATGGGYSQVLPMDDINLHFTGDLHAITAANNLLSALIDNHIYHGNALKIDPSKIYFHRTIDMNDRALRYTKVAGRNQGIERDEGFVITAASEVMAALCLANDYNDLKTRLGNIIVGANENGDFVYAKNLNAQGSMATLLKDAVKPNLVQTIYGTPAFIHGGPFANIAHGCNSIIATKTAMTYSDYTVTEAGFGADLGAEKFLDLKCRTAGIEPSAVVIVATARALKLHGGEDKTNLAVENISAIEKGLANLFKHIENITTVFKKPVVVALNRFPTDTEKELEYILNAVKNYGAECAVSNAYSLGADGAIELAEKVVEATSKQSKLEYAYELNDGIKEKINKIVTRIYGGVGAAFSEQAEEKIKQAEANGFKNLPVIIAKTQYSLSDDATLIARPTDFTLTVRDIEIRNGAGFIVAVAGKIMLMPGLPSHPAAENIDVDGEGNISGLF